MMQSLSFYLSSILVNLNAYRGNMKKTHKLKETTKISQSRETTYKILSTLGRDNPPLLTVEATEFILSKKNLKANEIIESIIKQVLFLRFVNQEKFNKAVDLVDIIMKKTDKKYKCNICEKHKNIKDFYVNNVKRNCCLTCYKMGTHIG